MTAIQPFLNPNTHSHRVVTLNYKSDVQIYDKHELGSCSLSLCVYESDQQRLIDNIMSSSGSKGKGKVTAKVHAQMLKTGAPPLDINFDDWTIAEFWEYDAALIAACKDSGKGGNDSGKSVNDSGKGDEASVTGGANKGKGKGKGKSKKNLFRRFLREIEDFDSDADEDDFKESFERWCSLQK